MDVFALSIQQFTSSLLTGAVCIGCAVVALIGLGIVALVVEASDTIPERSK